MRVVPLVAVLLVMVPSAAAATTSPFMHTVDVACRPSTHPGWAAFPAWMTEACATSGGDPGFAAVRPCTREDWFPPGSVIEGAYDRAREAAARNGACMHTRNVAWAHANATDAAMRETLRPLGETVCPHAPHVCAMLAGP